MLKLHGFEELNEPMQFFRHFSCNLGLQLLQLLRSSVPPKKNAMVIHQHLTVVLSRSRFMIRISWSVTKIYQHIIISYGFIWYTFSPLKHHVITHNKKQLLNNLRKYPSTSALYVGSCHAPFNVQRFISLTFFDDLGDKHCVSSLLWPQKWLSSWHRPRPNDLWGA